MTLTKRNGRPTRLPIGEISSGTLVDLDLAQALLVAGSADNLSMAVADRKQFTALKAVAAALFANPNDPFALEGDLVGDLHEVLNHYVPEYCRLGMQEGDGACLGVWPDDDALRDAEHDGELVRGGILPDADRLVGKGRHITARYWLYVNDHGNCTLYKRVRGQGYKYTDWQVVWEIV